MIRIAHISDLHFAKISFNPFQFFTKRWLGNFNSLLSRQKAFVPAHLTPLPSLFSELEVDQLIISGDLTTTSRDKEFAEAKKFTDTCKLSTFIIPGNHDHYTKKAYRDKIFYDYFPNAPLKSSGVSATSLGSKWWLVGLDTTVATPWFSSHGKFSIEIEKRLEVVLKDIPKGDSVLLVNHFPFFNNEIRKILDRADYLKRLLQQFPQVKLFLHGHTHRQTLADLRGNQLPIILDSGSTTHKYLGGWNLIDISDQGCDVHMYQLKNSSWEKTKTSSFTWEP